MSERGDWSADGWRVGTATCSAIFALSVLAAEPVIGQAQNGADDAGTTVLFQINQTSHPSPILLTGPLFTVALPKVSHTNLRLDTQQFLPNLGVLRGTFDMSRSEGSFAPSRGFVGISEVGMGSWSLDAGAGDQPFDVYPFDLGLRALYRPLTGVRGASVTATSGRTRVSLFGGRTTMLNGFFSESVLVSEQSVFGGRVVFNPSERLRVATSVLQTTGADPAEPLTPDRTLSVSASAAYELASGVSLVAETSTADFSSTVSDMEAHGVDVSSILGVRWGVPRISGELSWLRLGPAYLPFSYSRLGDRAGLFGTVNYNLGARLLLYGTVHRWHNQVGASTAPLRLNVNSDFVGARYSLTQATQVNGRVGASGVRSAELDADFADSWSRNLYLDLTHRFGPWRVSGRVNEIRTDWTGGTWHESLRRRADVEVRRSFGNVASAWGTVGTIRQRTDAAEVSSTAGSAGFSLPIGPYLSLFSEASWNSEIAGLSAVSISNTALNASVNWDLPQGFLLSASGRYSRDSSVLDGAPFDPGQAPALEEFLFDRISNSYQFTLRLQKRFGWGRSVQRAVDGARAGRPLEFGSISGVVFNDLDLDGVRGHTEPSVPQVAVRLDGEVLTAVGPDGSFEFGSVAVGPHTVELELVTVPASYDLGPRPRFQVHVTRGDTVEVPFPLLQLGKIRGAIVVADRTVEEVQDTAAPKRAGANLAVRLTDNQGTTRTTISDEDGEFEFTSLPTNEYQLLVDDTSLPDHWTVLTEDALTVTMTPGGRAENLQLAVAANPRPVRRIELDQASETTDDPLVLGVQRHVQTDPDPAQPQTSAANAGPVVTRPRPHGEEDVSRDQSFPAVALQDGDAVDRILGLHRQGRAENAEQVVAIDRRPERRAELPQRAVAMSDEPLSPALEGEVDERRPTNPLSGLPEQRLPPPSIAFGPFVNVLGGYDDGWVGRFVQESILVEAAGTPGTRIINPCALAGGRLRTLLPICREHEATMIMTGDYQRLGDQLRVTVQLVDATTRVPLRAMEVDGDLDDLLALQDRLAMAVAESLSTL